MRHAAKGPPFHSGPLATYRNGPVSSNVRRQISRPRHIGPAKKSKSRRQAAAIFYATPESIQSITNLSQSHSAPFSSGKDWFKITWRLQLSLRSTLQRHTVYVTCGSHRHPTSAVRSPSPRKCSWSALRAALLRQLVSFWARASDGLWFASVRAARVTLHTPVRQASSPRQSHCFLRRSAPMHLARLQPPAA